jgi:glycosyltransferase involved in cell wall biosynthesis
VSVRVCLVAPAYMTGGQAVEAQTLLAGFRDSGDVHVELQPIDPRLPAWLARIRGVRTIARMPLYYAGLIRRVLRADIVHVFTAAFWPFMLTTTPAILIGRLFGRPVILNYRDGRAADHIRYRAVRWILRRATVLVFPSGFLREIFRGFGLEGRVVHNVVDTERFRFRRRAPLRPVLLSVRLLEELYAVDNTILAFEKVRAVQPEARLIVVGDGDRRPALEALVAERGIAGVEFVGRVPHDAMAEWFDRGEVLVNSSTIDNMPHCLIEAFAAGMPVVTTGAGGIPFIVEHERNGLIVPIGDPDALAAGVLRVLGDGELADRLVAGGRADCAARYAWTAAREEWRQLYAWLGDRPAALEPATDGGAAWSSR